MAILVMFLFTRLFNRFSQEKVFYIMTTSFLGFFVFFMLVLYPLREIIHPNALADNIQMVLPKGFSGMIALFRNWSYALFYIMSELWGTAIMSVLFWGFVNEVTTVHDAKRFYGILLVGANLATICSAQLTVFFTEKLANSSFCSFLAPETKTTSLTVAAVTLSGCLILVIFRWYQTQIVAQKLHLPKKEPPFNLPKKNKMSLRKSFAFISQSKYLIFIAVIVVAFYLTNHMTEVIWKDQVKAIYPDLTSFKAYMGKVHRTIGMLSTIIGLFFCGPLIRRLGWTVNALATPLIMLTIGSFFFVTVIWKTSPFITSWTQIIGVSPLFLAVFLGTVENILSRGCKYSFFDATKEIAFIPLSRESKIKGKAAIDGIGSRLGKSGGAILQQALLIGFGTISLTAPVVGIFLLIVIIGWIGAAQALGREFNQLTAQTTNQPADEAPATLPGKAPSPL